MLCMAVKCTNEFFFFRIMGRKQSGWGGGKKKKPHWGGTRKGGGMEPSAKTEEEMISEERGRVRQGMAKLRKQEVAPQARKEPGPRSKST